VPFTCRAWMPGVRTVKRSGLPPGLHLMGGRGISMCAMVHSFFASLHSAKATGRPRSTSRLPLPVKAYCSFDILEQRLRLGNQVVDLLVAGLGLHDDLGQFLRGRRCLGSFRLGHGQRDFVFLGLLAGLVAGYFLSGSCRRGLGLRLRLCFGVG
jgi:hypothetical protein